jgi:hypothetical protein
MRKMLINTITRQTFSDENQIDKNYIISYHVYNYSENSY